MPPTSRGRAASCPHTGDFAVRGLIHDPPTVLAYRLHNTAGDDLGVLGHPSANVEPEDLVHLSDGREAT